MLTRGREAGRKLHLALALRLARGGGSHRQGQRLLWRSRCGPPGASCCPPAPVGLSVRGGHACRLSLPLRGWLKVLGAWKGGGGWPSSAGHAHTAPKGLLFEDVINEQLTGQEDAEQEPGAGALQEAWGRHLPGPPCGAQHA